MLSDRHLRVALWVVGAEIERRRRFGIPIPESIKSTFAALNVELSRTRHDACETTYDAAGLLMTAAEVAQRLGVTRRTIQRRAATEGVPKVGGRYVFSREDDT